MKTYIRIYAVMFFAGICVGINANANYKSTTIVSHAPSVSPLYIGVIDMRFDVAELDNKDVEIERRKYPKVTNGTGDPVMHSTGLGTEAVQTGILSSTTGSGLALSLPGNNDYVSIPDAPELQFGSQDFTVEFWVRLDSVPDFGDVILGKWNSSSAEGTNEWAFAVSHVGSPYFIMESGYSQNNIGDFSYTMNVDEWYHLALIRNAETIQLYVNGLPIAGGDSFSGYTMNITTLPITIGNGSLGSDDANITIDELRIWSEAIPTYNLQAWMCRKVNGDNHPNYNSMLVHYHFNEGQASDINDNAVVGNPNNGIPINNPQWITSGAPIGDASYTIYNPPFGEIFTLSHPDGDDYTFIA